MNNKSEHQFTDISSEETRSYTFLAPYGVATLTIKEPTHLAVSANGHRILDSEGISHYIPLGWIHLSWKAKAGAPHFVH